MNGDHDGEGHGHGDDAKAFADAVKDAWDKAKGKTGPGTYEITKIFVETSNPINEYRVQIKKV